MWEVMRMEFCTWKVRVQTVFVPLGCKIFEPFTRACGANSWREIRKRRFRLSDPSISTNVCRNLMSDENLHSRKGELQGVIILYPTLPNFLTRLQFCRSDVRRRPMLLDIARWQREGGSFLLRHLSVSPVAGASHFLPVLLHRCSMMWVYPVAVQATVSYVIIYWESAGAKNRLSYRQDLF